MLSCLGPPRPGQRLPHGLASFRESRGSIFHMYSSPSRTLLGITSSQSCYASKPFSLHLSSSPRLRYQAALSAPEPTEIIEISQSTSLCCFVYFVEPTTESLAHTFYSFLLPPGPCGGSLGARPVVWCDLVCPLSGNCNR